MAGFVKGMLTGLAIGAAGFVAAALLVPPDPAPGPDPQAAAPDEERTPEDAEVVSDSTLDPDPPAQDVEAPADASAAEPAPPEAVAEPEESAVVDPSPDVPARAEPARTEAAPVTPATAREDGAADDAAPAAPEAVRADADPAADAPRAEPAPVQPPAEPIAPAPAPEATGARAEDDEAAEPDGRLPEIDEDADDVDGRAASQAIIPAEDAPSPAEAGVAAEARALAAERGAAGIEALPVPGEETVTEAQPAPDPTPASPADAGTADAPAWQRHAAAFQATDERGLYAVILIDAPADPAAEAALLALTAPVTVALDPDDPDAPRRAQAYRSAGHEVAILAPGDDDAAPERHLAALPEAVAWVVSAEADEAILAVAEGAGLVVVSPAGAAGDLPDRVAPRARIVGEIAPGTDRIVAIARLDVAARRVAEEGVVAMLGRASSPGMIEALMQRAGRESALPAAPAPLTAAVAAAR